MLPICLLNEITIFIILNISKKNTVRKYENGVNENSDSKIVKILLKKRFAHV